METISIVTGGIIFVLGSAFAVFLGLYSDRLEAQREH